MDTIQSRVPGPIGVQLAGEPAVPLCAGVVKPDELDGLARAFVLGGDGVHRGSSCSRVFARQAGTVVTASEHDEQDTSTNGMKGRSQNLKRALAPWPQAVRMVPISLAWTTPAGSTPPSSPSTLRQTDRWLDAQNHRATATDPTRSRAANAVSRSVGSWAPSWSGVIADRRCRSRGLTSAQADLRRPSAPAAVAPRTRAP